MKWRTETSPVTVAHDTARLRSEVERRHEMSAVPSQPVTRFGEKCSPDPRSRQILSDGEVIVT